MYWKLFERVESLHLNPHRRTENRCGPDFFIKCHFDVFMRGAQRQGKNDILP